MRCITIDFETYYDSKFSLSKLTTEEYIRHDDFQVIGVAVKINHHKPIWFSGSHKQIKRFLDECRLQESVLIAHNAMFDAAILSWIFHIEPFKWVDTMSMARAIDGVNVSVSLKSIAERYGVGVKGTEVIAALGKRRKDFTKSDLTQYGEYCKNDCNLTFDIFKIYVQQTSPVELDVIDTTIRMFSEPILRLDYDLLTEYLTNVRDKKEQLMRACVADRDTLMSNPKFADMLIRLGVTPPTKISPATQKETFAFAKTDTGMQELLDHPDDTVQALVAARLGVKSTLEETRTERFINIAERGELPVPLRYYAAHTGRWGGSDKINLQNLPSRGNNILKNAIRAPDGYVIIDADSSQIEARVLAWLAGQEDLVEAFRQNNYEKWNNVPESEQKYDVYKIMASKIYGKSIADITKPERFMGKTVILGSGYGMGASKFQVQLKTAGVELELDECESIINTYRKSYANIPVFWKKADVALRCFLDNKTIELTNTRAVKIEKGGFLLPNGFILKYPSLQRTDGGFSYLVRKERKKIYGGKVVENICQAVARCIIAEQLVHIAKKYKVALTVHDAVTCVVKKREAESARAYIEEAMRTAPAWAEGLPLNCESGIGESYGQC